MLTLRRVVMKMKEFVEIRDQQNRLKTMENFINKVLEINQRKAIQKDPPMKYREVLDLAKEYQEGALEKQQRNGRERAQANSHGGSFSGDWRNNQSSSAAGDWRAGSGNGKREGKVEDILRKFLEGQKFKGKEYCIQYNIRDENGRPRCKNRWCKRAHNCAFIPRGQKPPCSKPHPKFEH